MTSGRKKKKRRVGCFTIFLIIIVLMLMNDSNNRVVLEEYELSYANLPAGFDGFRILMLSDLHAAEFGEGNAKLVSLIRTAAPDIIAVTGDLIDTDGQLGIVLPLMRTLSEIAPIYYITGNHEWAAGEARELLKLLPQYGAEVLDGKYKTIEKDGGTITLAGFADPNGPADYPSYDAVYNSIPENLRGGFVAVLVHRNVYLDVFTRLGADLVLCGHAHGGIIRLPGTDGLIGHKGLFPKYTSGVYESGETRMLVSRGLGNVYGIPRFLNNPQLAVAVLKSE